VTRRTALILLLALAAAVAGLLWLRNAERRPSALRRPRPFLRVSPAPVEPAPAPGEGRETPAESVRVTLYFPDREGEKLRIEERDIPRPARAAAFVRALFAELQRGPTRGELVAVIPSKLQLRNAFLLPEGEVVLDLAVDAGLSFGSAEELAIVASLVDTMLQNLAETRAVRILVNGEPAETLSGHVDLTRPLLFLREEIAS
jgi:spore germination protein GerM